MIVGLSILVSAPGAVEWSNRVKTAREQVAEIESKDRSDRRAAERQEVHKYHQQQDTMRELETTDSPSWQDMVSAGRSKRPETDVECADVRPQEPYLLLARSHDLLAIPERGLQASVDNHLADRKDTMRL